MTIDPDRQGYLLRSEGELLDVARDAIAHALALGASGASAMTRENAGTTIKVHGGRPASAVRDGGLSLGITVFAEGGTGFARTEAIDPASVRRAVDHACTIAGKVEADPDAGLPDEKWLALVGPEVPLFSPSGLSAEALTMAAHEIEEAAAGIATAGGVSVRVNEATALSTDVRWALATSAGFGRSASASVQQRVCVAIAEGDGEMTTDWSFSAERREADLLDARTLARQAVDRAAGKIGGRSIATHDTPVLFDARIAGSLVQDVVTGLSGAAQHQRATFLAGALGSRRLAAHVDLTEDPFEPFGLASAAWDSDGIAAIRRHVVREGVVEGYFLDALHARKLGMSPTGSADGPTNLFLSSRLTDAADDLAAMLRRMDTGVWITTFNGGGVNQATGSYSKAFEGFWIERGEIVHPIRDMTVAGDLPAMLGGIVAIGSDRHRSAMSSGSILIDTMRIAGQ